MENTQTEILPIKKKRGRKPKDVKVEVITKNNINIMDSLNITVQAVNNTDAQSSNASNASKANDVGSITKELTAPVEDTIPKKGKRGRKPKYVYSSFETQPNDDTNNISSLSDDENVIVRLSIVDDEISDVPIVNDEQPYAYNRDVYTNVSNVYDLEHASNDQNNIDMHQNNDELRVVSILKDFEEKNKHNEWPLNTSISCYWCCHRFDNAPIGIPVNYIKDTFEVFGCFCSTECAAAYNFNENLNQDEMWERHQLLNLLSRKMKLGNIVKSAPSRLSLKIFGGHMDIDAFRAFSKGTKFINVNFPPMTSITQQLEEINDFEVCNDFKYIPVDNDRINKYKERIVFRRNKPLIDTKKSLESTMNLKYT